MTVERTDILIVGAGLAGSRCAEVLRAEGYDGRILVVGDEPHPPYERPALSKELLVGSRAAAELALRKPGFWAAHGIELRLGTRIDSIDVRARRAVIGPASIRWRRLVLATGVRARRIPGLDGMAGIHYLRTLADAESLRDALVPGARLAIVGAGFVGLEVASSARALDLEVTVIEPAIVPFERTLGPAVGSLLAERARSAGVDLRLGVPIRAAFRRGDGVVSAVELGDGSRLACDAVLVGVGARPNTELAAGLFDLAPDGGVPTDACSRTAADGVFACGDVASVAHPSLGRPVRLEHWSAAAATAQATAGAILGRVPGRSPVPFFWSDQFGWRLQAVGHVDPALRVSAEGDGERFVARYRDTAGRLRAAVVGNGANLLPELRRELAGADLALAS
jgi:3-phenylpropionate/trans-cinnamate dioxygenase ferredoxin reductase component